MTASDDAGSGALRIDLDEDHDRYHRQSLISWWDQERLSAATVLVVGAGALGNELVKNLALVGVGRVVVVDMDKIENSNLSRCVFFRAEDEGEMKAGVLAGRASELNPEIEVIPVVGDVRTAIGLGHFDACDVVLGGLDNREARVHINQACWKTETPLVDGAIEGLLGMMRVFVPPDSACYECTMSARDHELIAFRRTCALLSREEMLSGKVPTTATTSSIIAGMQVQEAIKLLHRDRIEYQFAGKGVAYNGLTHDSYVVDYKRKDDCMAHDSYEIDDAAQIGNDETFSEVLDAARLKMGDDTVLDLEAELVVSARCAECDVTTELCAPLVSMDETAVPCPRCGGERSFEFTHTFDGTPSALAAMKVSEVIPPFDVLTARLGMKRSFYRLGTGSPIAALAE